MQIYVQCPGTILGSTSAISQQGASQMPARRPSGCRQRKTYKPSSTEKLPTTALPEPTKVLVLAKP